LTVTVHKFYITCTYIRIDVLPVKMKIIPQEAFVCTRIWPKMLHIDWA